MTKYVNGQDANTAYGPFLTPGSVVTWTNTVVNTGNTALTNVTVNDDRILDDSTITCGQTNNVIALLLPGGTHAVTCTVTGVATAGAYVNVGTAQGHPVMPKPATGVVAGDPSTWPASATAYADVTLVGPTGSTSTMADVTDTDPAHYFGSAPGLSIVKYTNGQDANTVTGPYIPKGGDVTWTYVVTNTGNTAMSNVVVTDDRLDPRAIVCDWDSVLDLILPGRSVTCTATGSAITGQYANTGFVEGTAVLPDPTNTSVNIADPNTWPSNSSGYIPVRDSKGALLPPLKTSDPSHYFGAAPDIRIRKEVCALVGGCDPDGHDGWVATTTVKTGSSVQFRITVRNTGNVDLAPVRVTDPVAPSCNTVIDSLAVGTLTDITADLVNVATATGQPVDGNGKPIIDPSSGRPTRPVTDTDDAAVKVTTDGSLAVTGTEVTGVLALAGALVGMGVLILVGATRRRRQES